MFFGISYGGKNRFIVNGLAVHKNTIFGPQSFAFFKDFADALRPGIHKLRYMAQNSLYVLT
jgi:hypothetical protein